MKRNSRGGEVDPNHIISQWAIARAGGWAGLYGDPIGVEWWESCETGELEPYPVYRFHDGRYQGCSEGLPICYQIGCKEAGKCLRSQKHDSLDGST